MVLKDRSKFFTKCLILNCRSYGVILLGGDYNDGGAGQGSLEDSIPGVPGTDYPIYAQIPETGFTCEGKV